MMKLLRSRCTKVWNQAILWCLSLTIKTQMANQIPPKDNSWSLESAVRITCFLIRWAGDQLMWRLHRTLWRAVSSSQVAVNCSMRYSSRTRTKPWRSSWLTWPTRMAKRKWHLRLLINKKWSKAVTRKRKRRTISISNFQTWQVISKQRESLDGVSHLEKTQSTSRPRSMAPWKVWLPKVVQ